MRLLSSFYCSVPSSNPGTGQRAANSITNFLCNLRFKQIFFFKYPIRSHTFALNEIQIELFDSTRTDRFHVGIVQQSQESARQILAGRHASCSRQSQWKIRKRHERTIHERYKIANVITRTSARFVQLPIISC